MNNNRYNLRSSAQPQIAPSFYPTSSTTGTATTGAGSTSTTTSTTGVSSSSFLPTQSTFQTGQAEQFSAQPGQYIGQQAQQQQHLFADAQAHAQAQQNMNTIPPTQAQVQPGQMPLGGPAATAPFLQDFTLVAEAVKRVQMDAVMTEMESITL